MRTIGRSREQRIACLKRCVLFAKLEASGYEAVAGAALVREYEPGEALFFQEEPARGFFIVAEGKVKVLRTGADGREQILHLFGRGDIVGEVPVFQGASYPATAMADVRAEVLYLARDEFLRLSRRHPDVLFEMLAVLSVRLRNFVNLIDDLALKEVSARLAKYLLDLRARAGGVATVRLDSSKAVLAARLGTVAETLSRTLKKLQARNVIDVDGRAVTIREVEMLMDFAAGTKL